MFASQPLAGSLRLRPGIVFWWGERAGESDLASHCVAVLFELRSSATCMTLLSCGELALRPPAPACFPAGLLFEEPAFYEVLKAAGAHSRLGALMAGVRAGAPWQCSLSPRARLALESIRSCPFAGLCREMALTARSHDLLVEFITQPGLLSGGGAGPVSGPESGVRLAAEILSRELENPPGLSELAGRVGLSESSLKRGFQQVYGSTVYGYLRTRRMEQARHLLEFGKASVLEASERVGYSNPSHFAAAFRREFGMNPKTFQLRGTAGA